MQEAPPIESGRKPERSARGRRLLLLVALVAVLPFAVAVYFVVTDWRPTGRSVNFGELIEPAQPLPAVVLRSLDGQRISTESLRGRWALITVAQTGCTAGCRSNLWKMQQVRLAQGKHMQRVERVLLIDDRARLTATALARAYPGTQVLVGDRATLAPLLRVLAGSETVGERVFLVDPIGNLVLRYGANADPVGLRKDLARLLRLSRIG